MKENGSCSFQNKGGSIIKKKRRTASGRKVKALADYVCDTLAGKMILHRYDSFTTNSVYLKFDYGVANSLRISDHPGYGYLSYRYNIILGLKKSYAETSGKYVKEFYPETMVDDVVRRIITMREEKIQRYRDYNAVVEKRKKQPDKTKSFWKCCREIR